MFRSVQTLVLTKESILLGRWNSGGYKHRITGVAKDTSAVCEEQLKKEAIQNVAEMTGVNLLPHNVDKRAVMLFTETDPFSLTIEHVFLVTIPEELPLVGHPEFSPLWSPLRTIPFNEMPEDDAVWYPSVLKHKYIHGKFTFNGKDMQASNIWTVPNIELANINNEHLLFC